MDAAGSSSSSAPSLRIVIFPWLAFGHLLPYLELAERLAARGHRVSFVSTPRNIARLPPLRPAGAAPRVELVALPLPRVDGLPDGAECTKDVPHDKLGLLFNAFDGLAALFAESFLGADDDGGKRPDWLIIDSFHYCPATAAVELKVPCAMLLTTAAVIADISLPERLAAMPRYESQPFTSKPGETGVSVTDRFYSTLSKCTLGAMRSCIEWEPEAFPLAATILGKPVVPLGLLPPSPDGGRRRAASKHGPGDQDAGVLRWLDTQPASSVVYVALGSEVPLRVEQVHELAHGLELAGTRFLWALRKPTGVLDDDILPLGFQERTHGHGMVTTEWVPQMSVLAHGALGAFLTHCGRNSLIEASLFGLPLVMLPIQLDQGPNARVMEGRKVGVQVRRDENDGSFHREDVAAAVRAVMVEEETRKVFVANALKLQDIVADKELQERYIDEFVLRLASYATET